MTTTAAALASSGIISLIKKILDDLYAGVKNEAINRLGKSRADIKEQPIARSLLSVTKVKTLWNIEKEVSLYDFYYPSTIEFSQSVVKKINSIGEFGRVGNYVIQGTAGQGKSIFLRFLCGQELKTDTSSGRLPIFIELRRISKEQNLTNLILDALGKYKLPNSISAWEYLANSGNVILLLDAFDEIDPSIVSRTLGEIEHYCELFRDNIQILVTSRPDADIQNSNFFRVFKLAPLRPVDHAPFLKKICIDKDQAANLLKVLKESSTDVSNLLTTPLMMTLLVILYKSLQTVPDTVPKFYEELFDVLFYRHDHSKPGFRRKRFTQLDDGSVKKLFSAFCFYSRLNNFGTLSNQQMEDCLQMASKATGITVDFLSMKSELIKTICLMQEEGFEISFIHKSVAQYYSASFVSKSADKFAEKFYELALNNSNWDLELKFLSEIDSYRFNKLFEIPLLKRICGEIGINIDIPKSDDFMKIEKYYSSNGSIVVTPKKERGKKGPKDRSNTFAGWSSGHNPYKKSRNAADEFMWSFVGPIFTFLELNEDKLPKELIQAEDEHRFIPVLSFGEIISEFIKVGGFNIYTTIHKRYKEANTVVETEGRKVDMLAPFLLTNDA